MKSLTVYVLIFAHLNLSAFA